MSREGRDENKVAYARRDAVSKHLESKNHQLRVRMFANAYPNAFRATSPSLPMALQTARSLCKIVQQAAPWKEAAHVIEHRWAAIKAK
jgi:hypothetical protein